MLRKILKSIYVAVFLFVLSFLLVVPYAQSGRGWDNYFVTPMISRFKYLSVIASDRGFNVPMAYWYFWCNQFERCHVGTSEDGYLFSVLPTKFPFRAEKPVDFDVK